MPRLVLSAVEAQLVRLAEQASGIVEARSRFVALVQPILAAHGSPTDARIEGDGDDVVLVTPEPVESESCDYPACYGGSVARCKCALKSIRADDPEPCDYYAQGRSTEDAPAPRIEGAGVCEYFPGRQCDEPSKCHYIACFEDKVRPRVSKT